MLGRREEPGAAATVRGALVAAHTSLLYAVTVVTVLLVAVAGSLSTGPSMAAAVALLGAMTLASVMGVTRSVAARAAAAVLLVLTGSRHGRPAVREPEPTRQQDPSTPGRPQPRAPGATPLPLTA